jgi:hypothetical protein
MARQKKFSEQMMTIFPPNTFAVIARLAEDGEDRSTFIRSAVEREIALRSLECFADLKAYLLANETIGDFCLKAIRRAVAQRKAALAGEALGSEGG